MPNTQVRISNHDQIKDKLSDNRFKVTIFGSARIGPGDPVYQDIETLAHMIAHEGYDLITGGGPGVMEAASKGHAATCDTCPGNTDTIGINIELPFEQAPNPYLNIEKTETTFSSRLDTFMLLTNVFVVAPGGIGTALELFYTWQLMQVHHICRTPIILLGDMWGDLKKWVEDDLLAQGMINPEDINIAIVAPDIEGAMKLINQAHAHFESEWENACVNIDMYVEAARQLGFVE